MVLSHLTGKFQEYRLMILFRQADTRFEFFNEYIVNNIGVRAGGGEGGCSPPKIWETEIFWAARENLGKAKF